MRNQLSDEAEALLRSCRADAPPDMAARQAKIIAALGAPALVTAASASAATSAGKGAASWLGLKGIGALLGVGALALVVHQVVSASPAPSPSVPAPSAPLVVAPVAPPVVLAPTPATPTASALSVWDLPTASASAGATAPAPPSADDLAAQLAFIESVRRQLATGDGAAALTALDAFAKRTPRSAVQDELTALRVEALVKAGRGDAAVTVGREFLRLHPTSLYAPRVRSLIGEAP